MDAVKPSQRALDICKQHYQKNCGRCPLGRECHRWEVTHTQEQLNEKVRKINRLAEELIEG
jgi:hypothetical protein